MRSKIKTTIAITVAGVLILAAVSHEAYRWGQLYADVSRARAAFEELDTSLQRLKTLDR